MGVACFGSRMALTTALSVLFGFGDSATSGSRTCAGTVFFGGLGEGIGVAGNDFGSFGGFRGFSTLTDRGGGGGGGGGEGVASLCGSELCDFNCGVRADRFREGRRIVMVSTDGAPVGGVFI